jgi:hypothetical protein
MASRGPRLGCGIVKREGGEARGQVPGPGDGRTEDWELGCIPTMHILAKQRNATQRKHRGEGEKERRISGGGDAMHVQVKHVGGLRVFV